MNGRELEARKGMALVAAPSPEKKFVEGGGAGMKRPVQLNGVVPRGGVYSGAAAAGGGFPFRGFRVTVHNLHPSVTWRDLKDFLRMAGEVRFANVVGPGIGIGEFGTPQERAAVIRTLNGKELKGNKVTIKHLNEMDPRFQSSRSFPPYMPQSFVPEPVHYGPAPGPAFEVPYASGFEPYPYNGGGPLVGPMEYHPVPFGPPPPRLAPWGQIPGRGGRGYQPFAPPFPPAPAANFGRGHIRPDAGAWGFPHVPPRPCVPSRGFERPPPIPYSQPAPPLRNPEFVELHEDPPYNRNLATVRSCGFVEARVEHVQYDNPPATERDYHGYSTGRYHAQIEAREKPNADYNGVTDDWNGYFGYPRETQSDGGHHYGKYDPPPQPTEKPDPVGRPPAPYPPVDDPRAEYAEYAPSHVVSDEGRKEYARSGGYTGYLDSSASYPKATSENNGGKYEYLKNRAVSDDYKYRMEEYSRGGGSYPSSEVYSGKEHQRSADYDYTRTEPRSYASEYKSREAAYYDRRSVDHTERSYRDDDPRGAGGAERPRHRSTHRTGPYDR